MRHRKAGLKLNRSPSHRHAMFRNMVTSLLKHDRIRTTGARAMEVRRWADYLITLAKRGDLHARRQALSIVREKDVVHKLFEQADERFGAVSGGYTRVIKLGKRPGDAASMSMVELIAFEGTKKKKKTKKTATRGKTTRKDENSDEERQQEAIDLVMEMVEDLFEERGEQDKVWGSMVKQALKRRKPGFNETYHGFRTFGKLLEEAQSRKLLELEHDEKSGGYIISSFNTED